MTAPIRRLYAVILLLFVALVAVTSWNTVLGAKGYQDNPKNARTILEELKIERGTIRGADGTVLARSVPAEGKTWRRVYPTGSLFAHAIGYSNASLGQRAGLERSRNDYLTGTGNELGTIVDELSGKDKVGDAITTTLVPRAQRVAEQQLAGREGAVVALDPRTGAVEVMAANPSYDPDHPFKGGSQLNRATQARYAPGSTFKVVTAVAGIDSGKYTPSSVLDGSSPKLISGAPLSNDGNESFGSIDLTTALTHSVNTVWAQVAVNVGQKTMASYMKRFGFGSVPPLDYPHDQELASGIYGPKGLISPTSKTVDIGRVGIGQERLAVAPLQMAMVAAAVANQGKLMRPHITDRIVDTDGRTLKRIDPTVQAQVMKPATAKAVGLMMQSVVKEGTGTAAALTGIDVAGKTGTAEIPCSTSGALGVQTWFIAFAPANDPKVAIAATVHCSGGQGGTVAAPIAKAVMQSLLGGAK